MTHRLLTLLAALLVVFATIAHQPAVARADDAAAAFKAALDHFHAGRYDQATPQFRVIAETTDSPNARLYYARSLRESGNLALAYEQMQQTVRDATLKAKTEARYVETRDAAASELAELEPRVGKLIVVLIGEPPDPSVTINGVALPADRVGKPFAVTPGSIAVGATAAGRQPAEQRVVVAAGGTETITLSLEAAASGDDPPVDAPPVEDEPDEGGGINLSVLQIAGIGVAVIGIGGIVLAGVSKAKSDDIFDTVNSECGGVRCTDPKYGDQIDEGKTFDTLTTVGLVVGIAGIVGGAAMIVFGGDDDTEGDSETAWSFGATPDSVGATVTGSF